MGVYDQIKSAFQDIIAPELHALRADIQRVDQKIDAVNAGLGARIDSVDASLSAKIEAMDAKLGALRTETVSMKGELLAEIRRLDARIDGVDRELRTAVDVRERLAALEARASLR
ncbi:MAG: hypothetical protein HYV94_08675 [Candidatus Rokubacteria bacterium]|nr:hypothetical protein [Candidatus Rokubacteria bacterium]MBI2492155.1 hypothetical protein [Candidatus Rokubacteria bacterium]